MTTILLVDDDQPFRSMLSEVLTRAGYEVQEAADGEQAIELYESEPTDLIITDLVMPQKEGLETIIELHRRYPEAKIIAMSGGERRGSQASLSMASAFGARRVLAKPFSHKQILEAIIEVLEGPQAAP